ncbi:MAG: lipopolysaccharide heptosyltransferase II [bacterium]|jgi:heptosyltransferase-2
MNKELTFAVKAPNWLGDAVMALPAISSVVECSRRGRVLVIGSTSSAGLCARLGGTLAYPVTRPGGGALESARSILSGSSVLRSFGPVMVLSFTRSFTSAAMCYLGRVPRRVGFEDSAGAILYTDRVRRPPRETTHLIDIYKEIVQAIGIPVDSTIPRLSPFDEDIARGQEILARSGLGPGRYVCMFPGARYGPAKMWPARRFGLLGDMIADRFDLEIVLAGGRQERSACQAVESAMRGRVHNLCGMTDLAGLIGVIWLSSGVVSNDSGGMHLSAALGKPVVGLFFSTDPAWTGPVSPNSVALYKAVDCSPCFERDCRKGNVCTDGIDEAEVLEALTRLAGLEA